MSSFKEPTTSRPLSHHRVSSSSTPLNVPGRHANSGSGNGSSTNHHHRQHAHSVSLGTLHHHTHNANRVTRRKSMTSNHIAAAVQHIDDASFEALVSPESRVARRAEVAPRSVSATSQPRLAAGEEARPKLEQGTGQPEATPASRPTVETKVRNRRASEGAHLAKEGKRVSSELKCDKCGKGYKHSSCLTKHLWEHTPEWALTSKLLISKHQQVQLLEAASVLVAMNQDPSVDLSKAIESDHSSASPEASGSSELLEDELSSFETTPPPMADGMDGRKRYSTTSSVYSRSYQSIPGVSGVASSMPSSSYGSYHFSTRPSTSGTSYAGLPPDDEAGLAAAVKLVNFGTPRSVAQAMNDVPPVPPLPARYAAHGATQSMSGIDYTLPQEISMQPLNHRISDERDTKMPAATVASLDTEFEDRRSISRANSEHEDGFFGRMEE